MEFATAAWTPFYGRFFRDASVPGHHREPAWLAFTARLEQILKCGEAAPLATATQQVYDELVAAPMVKHLAHERTEWEEDRPFGIWRYDAHEDYVALHIHNVYMPESPFAHMPQLFAWLQMIIDQIDSRGLSIARIGVDSWINWLPAFQALFPAEFAASLTPTTPDNKAGNGWWGQFINRTGHLNETPRPATVPNATVRLCPHARGVLVRGVSGACEAGDCLILSIGGEGIRLGPLSVHRGWTSHGRRTVHAYRALLSRIGRWEQCIRLV